MRAHAVNGLALLLVWRPYISLTRYAGCQDRILVLVPPVAYYDKCLPSKGQYYIHLDPSDVHQSSKVIKSSIHRVALVEK